MASSKSQLTFRTPYLDNDLVALTYRAPSSVRQSAASALRLVRDAHPRLSAIPTDRAVVAGGSGLAYRLRRFAAEVTFKLDYMHKEAPPARANGFPGMRSIKVGCWACTSGCHTVCGSGRNWRRMSSRR